MIAEMNGADLVACGLILLGLLGIALWLLVTWSPIATRWVVTQVARWHARQVVKANTPTRWEDRK